MSFLNTFLTTLKFVLMICHMFFYLFSTTLFYPLTLMFPYTMRKILGNYLKYNSRLAMKILQIKLNVENESKNFDSSKNYLIVSNHLSYLDVLSFNSIISCSFVTSKDVQKTPVLGQICQATGCLFVDRRSRDNQANEVEEITLALKNKINVLIFPEATSTNGEQVLRFRTPLFESALQSGIDILPLSINYESLDNQKVTIENRDQVCWYGDMTFIDHLYTVCKLRKINVTVKIGEPIQSNTAQDDKISLSLKSHSSVSRMYEPIVAGQF